MKLLLIIMDSPIASWQFWEFSAFFYLTLKKIKSLTIKPQMMGQERFPCSGQLSDQVFYFKIRLSLSVLMLLDIVFTAGSSVNWYPWQQQYRRFHRSDSKELLRWVNLVSRQFTALAVNSPKKLRMERWDWLPWYEFQDHQCCICVSKVVRMFFSLVKKIISLLKNILCEYNC